MYSKMQSKQLVPPRKVLIISNDVMLGEIATRTINRYLGCDVYSAIIASEAASYLYSGGFDLVIMDLSTPGLSGPMMVRKIQTMTEEIPVLIIADIDNSEDIDEIQKLGINRIMHKPIGMAQILEVVTGMLMETQRLTV